MSSARALAGAASASASPASKRTRFTRARIARRSTSARSIPRTAMAGQDARVLSPRRALALLLPLLLGAGCVRPYKGPKTLGAVATVLLASGATMWAVGERGDRQ